MKWDKIFANHMSNRGLIYKIYIRDSYNSTVTKLNLVLTWAKDLNKHFFKKKDIYINDQQLHEKNA